MVICKFFWGTTKQFTQKKATLEPLDLSLKKKFNQAVDANRRTTNFHASEPLDLSLKRKNEAKSSTTFDEPMAKKPSLSNEKIVLLPINMAFDKITKNPGLQHIMEDIFKLLDKKSLMNCRLVDHSWKIILDQPNFWLKNLIQDEKDYLKNSGDKEIDLVDSLKNLHLVLDDELQAEFVLVLMRIFKTNIYSIAKTKAFELVNVGMIPQNQWNMVLNQEREIEYQPNFLLEIVLDLKKTGKFPSLMKFILEHVDPYSEIAISNDDVYGCSEFKIDVSEMTGFRSNDRLTPIHLAAWFGILDLVQKLIAKYDQHHMIKTKEGRTPIHFAASNGHSNVVEFLAILFDEFDPNGMDNRGITPVQYAAESGYSNVIEIFASLPDPIYGNDSPISLDEISGAMIMAAINGHKNVMEILAPLTDDPNATDDLGGNTPLYHAVTNGDLDMVKFLVPLSHHPNSEGDDGYPMNIAAMRGHLEIVKYFAGLKDSKDFINVVDSEDGDTPLHSAAYYGHLDILKFLLPLSENPNYRNKIGETPIDTARKKQHENVVKFLENYYKEQ